MENFVCDCGKKVFIHRHSIVVRNGKTFYYTDRHLNTELKCECGKPLIFIEKEVNWDNGCASFSAIASMTPEQKKKVLLDRSHNHFNKEIKERKHEMEKATFGKSDY